MKRAIPVEMKKKKMSSRDAISSSDSEAEFEDTTYQPPKSKKNRIVQPSSDDERSDNNRPGTSTKYQQKDKKRKKKPPKTVSHSDERLAESDKTVVKVSKTKVTAQMSESERVALKDLRMQTESYHTPGAIDFELSSSDSDEDLQQSDERNVDEPHVFQEWRQTLKNQAKYKNGQQLPPFAFFYRMQQLEGGKGSRNQTQGFPSLEKCRQLYVAIKEGHSMEFLAYKVLGIKSRYTSQQMVKEMFAYIKAKFPGDVEGLDCPRFVSAKAKPGSVHRWFKRKERRYLDGLSRIGLPDRLTMKHNKHMKKKREGGGMAGDVSSALGAMPITLGKPTNKIDRMIQKVANNPQAALTADLSATVVLTEEQQTFRRVFVTRMQLEEKLIQRNPPKEILELFGGEKACSQGDGPKPRNISVSGSSGSSTKSTTITDVPDRERQDIQAAMNLNFKFAGTSCENREERLEEVYEKLKPAYRLIGLRQFGRYLDYCLSYGKDPCDMETNLPVWIKQFLFNSTTNAGVNQTLFKGGGRRLALATVQGMHRKVGMIGSMFGLLPVKYDSKTLNDKLGEETKKALPARMWTPRARISVSELDWCSWKFVTERGLAGLSPADVQWLLQMHLLACYGKRPQTFTPHGKGKGEFPGMKCRDVKIFRSQMGTLILRLIIKHEKQKPFGHEPGEANRRDRDHPFDIVRLMTIHLANLGAIDIEATDLDKGIVKIRRTHKNKNLFVMVHRDTGLLKTDKPMSKEVFTNNVKKLAETARLPRSMTSAKMFRRAFVQQIMNTLMFEKGYTKQQAQQAVSMVNRTRVGASKPYEDNQMAKNFDCIHHIYGGSNVKALDMNERLTCEDVTVMNNDANLEVWCQSDPGVNRYAMEKAKDVIHLEDRSHSFGYDFRTAVADWLNQRTLMKLREFSAHCEALPTPPAPFVSSKVLNVKSFMMNQRKCRIEVENHSKCIVPSCKFESQKGSWHKHFKESHANLNQRECPIKCGWTNKAIEVTDVDTDDIKKTKLKRQRELFVFHCHNHRNKTASGRECGRCGKKLTLHQIQSHSCGSHWAYRWQWTKMANHIIDAPGTAAKASVEVNDPELSYEKEVVDYNNDIDHLDRGSDSEHSDSSGSSSEDDSDDEGGTDSD